MQINLMMPGYCPSQWSAASILLFSLRHCGGQETCRVIYTLSYLVILDYSSISETQGQYNVHPWKPLPPGQRMLRAQCCVPLSPGPPFTLGFFPPPQGAYVKSCILLSAGRLPGAHGDQAWHLLGDCLGCAAH